MHVPFQGAAPAISSTIAGHASVVHMTVALGGLPAQGRQRAIVFRERPALPEVPTLAESAAWLWRCNADDEGEDDRSLTPSDTKTRSLNQALSVRSSSS
jgi:hypothetical protein